MKLGYGTINYLQTPLGQNLSSCLPTCLNLYSVWVPNVVWLILVLLVKGYQVGVEWFTRINNESLFFETFNPFACIMIMLGYLFWNHFNQEFLGTSSLNGVGIICVIFVTFNFNCCMVMDNPHSYITNVHSTMGLFSSSINTPIGPILQLLVLPFIRWSDREVSGIPHDQLTFHWEWVPISTTSIASSKA